MSKITNDCLTRSDIGCFIAVPTTRMAIMGVKGLKFYYYMLHGKASACYHSVFINKVGRVFMPASFVVVGL